jgi:hypothetical protein
MPQMCRSNDLPQIRFLVSILYSGMLLFLLSGCLSFFEASRIDGPQREALLELEIPDVSPSDTSAYLFLAEDLIPEIDLPDQYPQDQSVWAKDAALLGLTLADWLPASAESSLYHMMYLLTERQRMATAKTLRRAEIYLPSIMACLESHGIPRELAALPFIESAFLFNATSRAGAGGIWQLMPETARSFGLIVNTRIDERYDAIKAGKAAARYLVYLHQRYGDWPLVLAAYNVGEGVLNNALRRSEAKDMDELLRFCRTPAGQKLLPKETLQFVPKFNAALLVMALSRRFGLCDYNVLKLTKNELEPDAALVPDQFLVPPDPIQEGQLLSLPIKI